MGSEMCIRDSSYPARVAALRFSVLANDVLRLVGPGLRYCCPASHAHPTLWLYVLSLGYEAEGLLRRRVCSAWMNNSGTSNQLSIVPLVFFYRRQKSPLLAGYVIGMEC